MSSASHLECTTAILGTRYKFSYELYIQLQLKRMTQTQTELSRGVLVLLNFCKILVSARFCRVCAR